jgi:hypothetical protein
MKKLLLPFLAIVFGAAMTAQSAFASDKFYVEIGGDVDEADAQKEWHALSKQHKALLGGLYYYPKDIYQDGKKTSTRIQAGPINGKTQAQKICKQLFAKKVPCFVIEDISQAPPSSVASLTEKAQERGRVIEVGEAPKVLPWLAAEAPPIQEPEEGRSLWTRLVDNLPEMPEMPESANDTVTAEKPPVSVEIKDVEIAQPAKPAKSDKKADVAVAEAIRVPLTQEAQRNDDVPVAKASLGKRRAPAEQNTLVTRADRAGDVDKSGGNTSPGWLNVASFSNESQAAETWQKVRKVIPEKAAGLRIRILKPLPGQADATLNIGPFASQNDADTFCQNGVRAVNSGLLCNFSINEPTDAVAEPLRIVPERNYAYAERREALLAERNARLVSAAGTPTKMNKRIEKAFWVEVLSAKSQIEALDAWEELRTAHSELFQGKRSSVSTSAANPGTYVVRVGPMAENAEATDLCKKLKERSIECGVAQSSR